MPRVGRLGMLEYAPVADKSPFCVSHEDPLRVEMRLSLINPYKSMALSVKHERFTVGWSPITKVISATDCFKLEGNTKVSLTHDESALGTPFFVSLFSLLEVFGGGKLVADYGRAIDKRGVVQIKMTAAGLEQTISEPCAFAIKLAKAMAESYDKEWRREFFKRVYDVLVEHLGASGRIDHCGQFTCIQPTGETLTPGGKPGGRTRFYIDDSLKRFRVNCDIEYHFELEKVIQTTNKALEPLAAEWFARKK